ncbi:MAG: hypothetical protein ABIE74_12975 [Pseudomonadota bacterium]
MTKRKKTIPIAKNEWRDYWQKSQNFFRGMLQLSGEGNWDSAASLAIHTAIQAADAILIYSQGYKNSGEHSNVARLISQLSLEGTNSASQHLSKILSVKSLVEYSGDSYLEEDFAEIAKQTERFMNWGRQILPKQL